LEKSANIQASYKSGDLDTCLELSVQLLHEDPENIVPLEYAARVHSKRRDPQLAKPYWHKLIKRRPDWAEPFLQAARIARLEKDWASCERYIDKFICQNPDHPEALGLQVQCYLERENAAKIGQAISRLSELNPNAVPPFAVRAAKHGMGSQVAQALSHQPANADAPALTAVCTQIARALRDAAIGFEIRKQPFSAANCYQALSAFAPASAYPATALTRLCKPYLGKAQAAYKAKAYADALRHAKTCLKISPEANEPRFIARRASARLAPAPHCEEGPL